MTSRLQTDIASIQSIGSVPAILKPIAEQSQSPSFVERRVLARE
jgi:hypothetical protein